MYENVTYKIDIEKGRFLSLKTRMCLLHLNIERKKKFREPDYLERPMFGTSQDVHFIYKSTTATKILYLTKKIKIIFNKIYKKKQKNTSQT